MCARDPRWPSLRATKIVRDRADTRDTRRTSASSSALDFKRTWAPLLMGRLSDVRGGQHLDRHVVGSGLVVLPDAGVDLVGRSPGNQGLDEGVVAPAL